MSGEKLPLIVVGKYEKPGLSTNTRVPVENHAQKSAWMTVSLFEQILVKFDRSMGYKNRQVLLFADNCSAHPKIQLKKIRLIFFPPSVTSPCQPMDMGVIHSLKINYKIGLQRRKIQFLNVGPDAHPINLLDAIFLLKKTWLNGVAASVIVNCFRKTGFSMNLQEPEVLCITDQENEEAEPVVYTDGNLLTSAPMEGEDITLPSASVTDPENLTEVVEGRRAGAGRNHRSRRNLGGDCAKHMRGIFGFEDGSDLFLSKGHEEDAAEISKFAEKFDRIAVDSLKQTTIDKFF